MRPCVLCQQVQDLPATSLMENHRKCLQHLHCRDGEEVEIWEGEAANRFSYNLPTTQHNYRPINAAVEKNGAQYISQIVRQRSDPGRGIWLVYQLNIWPRGKKCEENIPRQNNWDRIKGCDGSKWPRGTFCVGILPIFASRPFLQSVEVNSLEDSIKPNIALW